MSRLEFVSVSLGMLFDMFDRETERLLPVVSTPEKKPFEEFSANEVLSPSLLNSLAEIIRPPQ